MGQCPQACPKGKTTRSPLRKRLIFEPTSSTTPADSWPNTAGNGGENPSQSQWPCQRCQSERQMPLALTLTSTSSAPTSGSGQSSQILRGFLKASTTAAFMASLQEWGCDWGFPKLLSQDYLKGHGEVHAPFLSGHALETCLLRGFASCQVRDYPGRQQEFRSLRTFRPTPLPRSSADWVADVLSDSRRPARSLGGASDSLCATIAGGVGPSTGVPPASISRSTHHRAQTSARPSAAPPIACSGLMYFGVPTAMPVAVVSATSRAMRRES